jgi:hypothetical protein
MTEPLNTTQFEFRNVYFWRAICRVDILAARFEAFTSAFDPSRTSGLTSFRGRLFDIFHSLLGRLRSFPFN